MLKYKTGQRVRVSKNTDRFIDDMGKEGTIVCICSELRTIGVAEEDKIIHIYRVLLDEGSNCGVSFSVAGVSMKEIKYTWAMREEDIEPLIAVGEQLEFGFMKERNE